MAERAGVPLTVFQNRRLDGDFLTARRVVEGGELGTVLRFESRFERFRPDVGDGWRELPAQADGGGLLLDLGAAPRGPGPRAVRPAAAGLCRDRRSPAGRGGGGRRVPRARASGRRALPPVDERGGAAARAAPARERHRARASPATGSTRRSRSSSRACGRATRATGSAAHGRLVDAGGSRELALERGAYERFYEAVVPWLRDGAPAPVDPRDSLACLRVLDAARAERRQPIFNRVERNVMKTSLGIWALGPDGHPLRARRLPAGAQLPGRAHARTRSRAPIAGLGDLIDGYEFHYPQELSDDNLAEVRAGARRARHLLHGHRAPSRPALRQGRALVSGRRRARARRSRSAWRPPTSPRRVGAQLICWPGIEGYNYPFQTPYARSWGWFIEGMGAGWPSAATSAASSSSSSTRTPSPR